MPTSTTNVMVTTDHAVPVEPLGGAATVKVNSGDTVYYSDNPTVDATHNIASITSGNSAVVATPAWLKSAGTSSVTISTADPSGPEAATSHYDLGRDSAGNMAIGSTLPAFTPGSTIGVGAVGTGNVYVGYRSGNATTNANDNTAVGTLALTAATTGGGNVAVGSAAMKALTTGSSNVAVGFTALQAAIAVADCTAVGRFALQTNVTGINCTAIGSGALGGFSAGDVGNDNTALGMNAGANLQGGSQNTYAGMRAGYQNLTAQNETAVGWHALENSNTGSNTAVGSFAGNGVTSATQNAFVGLNAGQSIVTSGSNVVVGAQAGRTGTTDVANMTLLGHNTQGSGRYGIAIGESAAITASGAVAIGVDNAGTAATAAVANDFVLGTALHQIKVLNNQTGAGSAALGANCPAVTATAPFTWFKMKSGDGSTVYVPAWK